MKKLLTLLALSTSFVAGAAFSADDESSSSSSEKNRQMQDALRQEQDVKGRALTRTEMKDLFAGLEADRKASKAKAAAAVEGSAVESVMEQVQVGKDRGGNPIFEMRRVAKTAASKPASKAVEGEEVPAPKAKAAAAVEGSAVESVMEQVQVGKDRGGNPIFEMRRVAKTAASKPASKAVEGEEVPAPKAKAAAVEGSAVESEWEQVQVGKDRGGNPIFEMRRVAKAAASKAASKPVEGEDVPSPKDGDESSSSHVVPAQGGGLSPEEQAELDALMDGGAAAEESSSSHVVPAQGGGLSPEEQAELDALMAGE